MFSLRPVPVRRLPARFSLWSVSKPHQVRRITTMADNCIFCKIIKGTIPSAKVYESSKTLAFLDIQPLSRGHTLVIPKYHGAKLADIPDEHLQEITSVLRKVAIASGATDYNILQNNGRPAHQMVDHVHFHMIPKPNAEEGLIVGWPANMEYPKEELAKVAEELKSKM